MNFLFHVKAQRTLLQAEDTHDVQLGADQDNELQRLIREIEENGQSQLEGVFQEAEKSEEEVGDELRKVWERDVTSRKEFFEDQLKNSKLCKHLYWYHLIHLH